MESTDLAQLHDLDTMRRVLQLPNHTREQMDKLIKDTCAMYKEEPISLAGYIRNKRIVAEVPPIYRNPYLIGITQVTNPLYESHTGIVRVVKEFEGAGEKWRKYRYDLSGWVYISDDADENNKTSKNVFTTFLKGKGCVQIAREYLSKNSSFEERKLHGAAVFVKERAAAYALNVKDSDVEKIAQYHDLFTLSCKVAGNHPLAYTITAKCYEDIGIVLNSKREQELAKIGKLPKPTFVRVFLDLYAPTVHSGPFSVTFPVPHESKISIRITRNMVLEIPILRFIDFVNHAKKCHEEMKRSNIDKVPGIVDFPLTGPLNDKLNIDKFQQTDFHQQYQANPDQFSHVPVRMWREIAEQSLHANGVYNRRHEFDIRRRLNVHLELNYSDSSNTHSSETDAPPANRHAPRNRSLGNPASNNQVPVTRGTRILALRNQLTNVQWRRSGPAAWNPFF